MGSGVRRKRKYTFTYTCTTNCLSNRQRVKQYSICFVWYNGTQRCCNLMNSCVCYFAVVPFSVVSDVSWLIPGVERTRGGVTRKYSELLDQSDAACEQFFGLPALPITFPPERIAIVTNGFCGSSCSSKGDISYA